jgi:hypothetical protein
MSIIQASSGILGDMKIFMSLVVWLRGIVSVYLSRYIHKHCTDGLIPPDVLGILPVRGVAEQLQGNKQAQMN